MTENRPDPYAHGEQIGDPNGYPADPYGTNTGHATGLPSAPPPNHYVSQMPTGKNTLALVAMIVGIVAVVSIFVFVFAAPFLGIAALIMGIIGLRKVPQLQAGKGFSITGIITGSVAIVLGAILSILAIAAIAIIGQAASETASKAKDITTPASYSVQASVSEGDGSLTYQHLGNVLYVGENIDESVFDGENGSNGMGDAFTSSHEVDLKGYKGDTVRVTVNADYVNSPDADASCKILMDGKVVAEKTSVGSVTCQYAGN